MSLLNDMLRDLERRQAPARNNPMVPPPAPKPAALWRRVARPVLIGGALVTCLVVGAWWVGRTPFSFVVQELGTSLTEMSLPELIQPTPSQPAEPQLEGTESLPMAEVAPTQPSGAKVLVLPGQESELVTPPQPDVSDDRPQTSKLATPSVTDRHPVQDDAVAMPQEDPTAAVVTEAAVQEQVFPEPKASSPVETPGEQALHAVSESPPAGQMSKRPVLSPEQADRQVAAEAQQMWLRGEMRAAEQKLRAYLAANPQAGASRALLAQWWLQAGRHLETEALLAEVDASAPASLRKLKARLWQGQGRVAEALALLQGEAPALGEDPEFHGLLAALYIQQGSFAEAARGYAALLELRPDQADWWAGLGIALEGDGQVAPARRAYEQARSLGELHPQLRAHVEARLSALSR